MGYTLRKAPLRIESASGAYMPFSMFNSILTRDPTLKEVSKTGLVEDVAGIPWQQYDEMRHSLTLQSAQIEMLMQLQQIYGFWFRDAERITQKAATSMGNVERVHDKWLLRMLRKVKGQRQVCLRDPLFTLYVTGRQCCLRHLTYDPLSAMSGHSG